MPTPRFIRIGAPSGDGPLVAATAPQPAAPPRPVPQGSVLPPEVFGVWSEDPPPAAAGPAVPAPSRPQGNANGRGASAAPARTRPPSGGAGVRASGPIAPAPMRQAAAPQPAQRGGRISHEDERLNVMRKSGLQVEAVCFDDLRLRGRLVAFDQYALILEDGGEETVIFKHGVILVRYAE